MTAPYYDRHGVTVHAGDCLDVLATMPDASIDAVVCDPPYGLGDHKPAAIVTALTAWANGERDMVPSGRGFMGRDWDAFVPPPAVWDECLRVLRPGGYLACFSAPRTVDLMGLSIRMAGFEIRDGLQWIFGSGFPKSRNVSADLDALPRCRCGISEVPEGGLSVEQTASPTGAVRADVGAVPGTVSPAGLTADGAGGERLEPGAGSFGRVDEVQAVNANRIGQCDPVVLGSSGVAGAAQREQVLAGVGGVEVDPEALRDEVVGEQPLDGPAIGTVPVSLDHLGGDPRPLPTSVLPLTPAPRGIASSGQGRPVVERHAVSGAVGSDVGPAPELDTADLADVDSVALGSSRHDPDSTAERRGLRRCDTCSGLIGSVPAGLGTALKPAHEPIVLARKPLVSTVAANVLAHGTGALNIDGCRVATGEDTRRNARGGDNGLNGEGAFRIRERRAEDQAPRDGRWPSNVLLGHGETCADECVPGCPVAELDAQSGCLTSGYMKPETDRSTRQGAAYGEFSARTATATYGDTGGASRFFPVFRWEAKAPTSERPQVDGVAHPTVKPLDLMRWLVRLVTPPGALVLDPFAGSGTTLHAARAEGFRAIGIERESAYLPLIKARLDARARTTTAPAVPVPDGEPMDLLDLIGDAS